MADDVLPTIELALTLTGLPWEISQGSRHHKIKLAGRLVGIAPLNRRDAGPRALKNILAQIRRAARELNL